MKTKLFGTILLSVLLIASAVIAEQKGEPFWGRNDPSAYKEYANHHGGAGSVYFMEILPGELFTSDVYSIRRGIIPPGASIGEHLNRNGEEMYFIWGNAAQITVNGETALMPPGASVLCPLGSSIGIYNQGEKPVEWMNIIVSTEKGVYSAIDFDDDLTGQTVMSPAPYKWGYFDEALTVPVGPAHLGAGKILNNKPWLNTNFSTNWFRIGHCILPKGTSIGYHRHNATEEVYYVMSGTGLMTVNDVTWEVSAGDAIPCTLFDSHGLYSHTDDPPNIFVLIVKMDDAILDDAKLQGNYNTNFEDEYKALEVYNWGDDLSGRKPNR